MEALISGELGAATLINGNVAEIIWVDGRNKRTSPINALSIYRDVGDVVSLKNCTKTQALESLRLHWMKERALVLVLILLDPTTPIHECKEIQHTLNDWMNNVDVAEYVKFVMYSRPLPYADLRLNEAIDSQSNIGGFLNVLFDSQADISLIRESWDTVSSNLTSDEKYAYEKRLISIGAFYRLVNATKMDIQNIKFECFTKLSDLQGYREIVVEFLDPLVVLDESSGNLGSQNVIDFTSAEPFVDAPILNDAAITTHKSSHEFYLHVKNRIKLAGSYFQAGDYTKANKTIEWLVNEQQSRGDTKFAAMTLCSASEMAKQAGMYDRQLEYSRRAHDLSPDDVRVYGHIGDAYLNLGDLANARGWFIRASRFGDDEYGTCGLVRVLRKENRLQEAYKLISKVFENHEVGLDAWTQKAEILRGLARYDEAIEAYNQASKIFPDSNLPLCGMAAACVDAGYYRRALEIYDRAILYFQTESVPYTGKGHLLARLGDLKQALPYLTRGIELARDKSIGISALASALRMNGKPGKAIRILEDEKNKQPDSEVIWSGLIESAIQCGKYNEATLWMSEALKFLGKSPIFALQEAKILASKGDFNASLKKLDNLLSESPNFVDGYVYKSQLLRRFGRTSEARQVILGLLGEFLTSYSLKAEAALLSLSDLPEDVVSNRVGTWEYATLEDWEYGYACSVALIEKNSPKGAWRISLDGKKRSPFRSQRRRFGLVLAVARDMLGRVGSIVNAVKGFSGPEASLMKAIAFWKLGLNERLERLLKEMQILSNGVSNVSVVEELVNMVSSKYDHEIDSQRAADYESRILLQAA